jgi:hypothetical protein
MGIYEAILPGHIFKTDSCDGESDAFSLILTFSRWEKEQPLVVFVKSASVRAACSRRLDWTLEAILPLPAGEGRGEGERGFNLPEVLLLM